MRSRATVRRVGRLRDVIGTLVRAARPQRPGPMLEFEPGRSGPHATTVAHEIGRVITSYNPDTDGDPDPGEIVWTCVSICHP